MFSFVLITSPKIGVFVDCQNQLYPSVVEEYEDLVTLDNANKEVINNILFSVFVNLSYQIFNNNQE